ncbi:uracil-DNA glycosylase, family 4 [Saccharomonospora azurea SZMC 14600]|uniref:hypothetical protein n=1 Tax=Saccharomonospora azurea TaxID=40988 RepID=UPI00023FF6AB|nr:hypothetical protein [Saccharomonospora azurea]EHK86059.1 uracil-DNA glycosylase, family 4 [Saccharomonospora azurea SZMC 14600]
MVAQEGAQHYVPRERTLTALREASADCRGCDLHRDATQTVFGEGPTRARIVMVGDRDSAYAGLVADLTTVASAL